MSNQEHDPHWALDPTITYLNHGSFGACPRAVVAYRDELLAELEREPMTFFVRRLPSRLEAARTRAAMFVGGFAGGFAFVPNATHGVNTVLRSLSLAPGDRVLTTDHVYPACLNALRYLAAKAGAEVDVVTLPFPIADVEEATAALLAGVRKETKLALLDHVTSPTGIVWPIAEWVSALQERGVDALVDGAHAPGMLELDVDAIGAAYYTGNFHKWVCTPRGAAFLHVRSDKLDVIRPLALSHGLAFGDTPESRFRHAFDWTGTADFTPWLSVPYSIEYMDTLHPEGWAGLRRTIRERALEGRKIITDRLGLEPPCPESLVGSLAAILLPDRKPDDKADAASPGGQDPLHEALFREARIDVPVFAWPKPPSRVLRISAQLYNRTADYERLADALAERL